MILFSFHPAFALVAAVLAAINLLAMRAVSRASAPHQQKLLFEEHRRDSMAFNGISMAEALKADGAEGWFFPKWAGLSAKALAATQDLLHAGHAGAARGARRARLARRGHHRDHRRGADGPRRGDHGDRSSPPSFSSARSWCRSRRWSASARRRRSRWRRPACTTTRSAPNLDPQYAAPAVGLPETDGGLRGGIEFRDISFGYDRQRGPVIEDLSFRVEPGQRVAVVGRTGSGKSTVARLLTGAVKPWPGRSSSTACRASTGRGRRSPRPSGTSSRTSRSSRAPWPTT